MKKITGLLFFLSIFAMPSISIAAGFTNIPCKNLAQIFRAEGGTPEKLFNGMRDNGVSQLSSITAEDISKMLARYAEECPQAQYGISVTGFDAARFLGQIQAAAKIEEATNARQAKDSRAAEVLATKLTELEAQMTSASPAYKEIAQGFSYVMTEAHENARTSIEFHNKYRDSLYTRAENGRIKILSLWRDDLDKKISQELTTFNAALDDPNNSGLELLAMFAELNERLKRPIEEYLSTSNVETNAGDEIFSRLHSLLPKALNRFSAQIVAEMKTSIASMNEFAVEASLNDIAKLKSMRESTWIPSYALSKAQCDMLLKSAEIKNVLSHMDGNRNLPELREFYQSIDRSVGKPLFDLNKILNSSIERICGEATQKKCAELVADLDPKYKDHVLSLASRSSLLTLSDFVCAAKDKGLYKKFSSGGFFSSAITLELENGTIYFRDVRIDSDTMQEVGSSFKGANIISALIATEFEPPSGKKVSIDNGGQEIFFMFLRLGGLPKVAECQ